MPAWKTITIRTSNQGQERLWEKVDLLFTLTPVGDLAELRASPVALEVQTFDFTWNSELHFSTCRVDYDAIVVPEKLRHVPARHFAEYGIRSERTAARWSTCRELHTGEIPNYTPQICVKNKSGEDVRFAVCVSRSFPLQGEKPQPAICFPPLRHTSSVCVPADLELQIYCIPSGYRRNEMVKRKVERGQPLLLHSAPNEPSPLRVDTLDAYSRWHLYAEPSGKVVLRKDPSNEVQDVIDAVAHLSSQLEQHDQQRRSANEKTSTIAQDLEARIRRVEDALTERVSTMEERIEQTRQTLEEYVSDRFNKAEDKNPGRDHPAGTEWSRRMLSQDVKQSIEDIIDTKILSIREDFERSMRLINHRVHLADRDGKTALARTAALDRDLEDVGDAERDGLRNTCELTGSPKSDQSGLMEVLVAEVVKKRLESKVKALSIVFQQELDKAIKSAEQSISRAIRRLYRISRVTRGTIGGA